MALKPYRQFGADDITFYLDETAEMGQIVWFSTGGSGQATDQSAALLTSTGSQSGKTMVGVLMQDMVNIDLTQYALNKYKDQVQKGGKVLVWTKGVVVTDRIYPGLSPAAGGTAYAGPSGLLQTVNVNSVASPVVGVFLSSKDADGYAKVSINLP